MSKDAIVLTGVKETLNALESFDKQAVKEFTKVINSELAIAKKDAQGFVAGAPPLSGWNTQPPKKPRTRGGAGWPSWDQSVIRQGISTSKAEGKVRRDYTTSAGSIRNKSASGVIYELAGRTNRSGRFISNLEKKEPKASRLIWKSVDKNKDRIIKNVYSAFEDVKSKLQKNLDKERA